jgi:hypothetical protein
MPGKKRQQRPEPSQDVLESKSRGSKEKNSKHQKKNDANRSNSSKSVATTSTPSQAKSTLSNMTTTTTTPKRTSTSGSKNTSKNTNASMDDWISSLAKESVQVQFATSGGTTSGLSKAQAAAIPNTKEERMERRAAKKARRLAKRTPSTTTDDHENEQGRGPMMQRRNENDKSSLVQRQHHDQALSNQRLQALAVLVRSIDRAKLFTQESSSNRFKKSSQAQQHQPVRGGRGAKAGTLECKKMKRPWDETTIQPRSSDYSGIGLARTSLYVRFDDLSFFPKLKQEFAEHIPGFFGKQRSKAVKRQLDGNMLWRQLLANRSSSSGSGDNTTNAATIKRRAATAATTNSNKSSNDHGHNKKNLNLAIHGKKFSKMTPDERVEAMIQAGMI